ncbi:hypothetical protein PX699_29670 [Sphingobium sp. H39-3-25]|nr:hypothetical protein [Sphingobium arseniciresistens]
MFANSRFGEDHKENRMMAMHAAQCHPKDTNGSIAQSQSLAQQQEL